MNCIEPKVLQRRMKWKKNAFASLSAEILTQKFVEYHSARSGWRVRAASLVVWSRYPANPAAMVARLPIWDRVLGDEISVERPAATAATAAAGALPNANWIVSRRGNQRGESAWDSIRALRAALRQVAHCEAMNRTPYGRRVATVREQLARFAYRPYVVCSGAKELCVIVLRSVLRLARNRTHAPTRNEWKWRINRLSAATSRKPNFLFFSNISISKWVWKIIFVFFIEK